LGTKAEINVTGSIADVLVEGYTWNVNFVSGTFAPLTIADVEFYPVLSGGSCNIGTAYYGNVVYPFERGQTMKSVSQLSATLFHSPGMARTYTTPIGELSFDHTFIVERSETAAYIKRTTTDEFVTEYYTTDEEETEIIGQCLMYNDCTAYTTEVDLATGDYLIRKVVFDGSSGTATTVYTVSADVAYSGYTYTIYDIYYFNRLEYGTTKCIILVLSYHNDTFGDIFRCIVYHPNSGISHSQVFDCGFYADTSFHYATAPAIYRNKFIFTLNPYDYYTEPDPTPITCYCPTFILDVNDHSLEMVNDYLTDKESGDYLRAFGGSGIDYATGIYYFTGDNNSGYLLFSMNIEGTPSISAVSSTNMHLFQGPIDVYGVDRIPAPGNCSVRSIPDLDILTTVNIYVEHGADYFEGACAIDHCHDIIWNIRSDKIEGKALNATATSRDIPVTWPGGGTVPFAYANNRELFMRILAGRVLVLVYSTGTVGQYQSDWFLLRECVI